MTVERKEELREHMRLMRTPGFLSSQGQQKSTGRNNNDTSRERDPTRSAPSDNAKFSEKSASEKSTPMNNAKFTETSDSNMAKPNSSSQKNKPAKEPDIQDELLEKQRERESKRIRTKRIDLGFDDHKKTEPNKEAHEDPLLQGLDKDPRTNVEYASNMFQEGMKNSQERIETLKENWQHSSFFSDYTKGTYSDTPHRPIAVSFSRKWVFGLVIFCALVIAVDQIYLPDSSLTNAYLVELNREKERKELESRQSSSNS
jgi:hypothetical protein